MRDGIGRMKDPREDGAAAIEFALVLPLLVLLVFGVIHFGMAFNASLAVTHAAREGARLAAVGRFDSGAVISRAFPLTPDDGLTVSGPVVSSDGRYGDVAEVTVRYPYTLSIPLWGTVVVPLRSVARMRVE